VCVVGERPNATNTVACGLRLYEAMSPNWCHEPELLVGALQLPEEEIWRCHRAAKADLIGRASQRMMRCYASEAYFR